MPFVYIIEDDLSLRDELTSLLGLHDIEVAASEDFANAAEDALLVQPDCILLDLNLPGASGLEICQKIRRESDCPIMILTSSMDEFDEVMSMNLGADDYINKPFSPAVLIAHIRSLLRRAGNVQTFQTLEHGGVRLDIESRCVSYGEERSELTGNEFHILKLLMENPDSVITRKELMCSLWESDAFVDDNTLTVNVNRLRSTLGSIGVPESFLKTRRGQGYSL